MVAQTDAWRPGKGGIKGLEVNMGAKSLLILRKESVLASGDFSEFETEEKEKVQNGDGIKWGTLVEDWKRLSDWVDSTGSLCNIHL